MVVGWRFGVASSAATRSASLFAALLAFAGGSIQAAHVGTSASLLVLWLLAIAFARRATVQTAARMAAALLYVSGVFVGLAAATTTPARRSWLLPLDRGGARAARARRRTVDRRAVVVIGVAALVFAAVSPHSLQHADAFRPGAARRVRDRDGRGAAGLLDTLQFRGAPPLHFEIANLHWLAGPLIPFLGVVGLIALAVRARRDARWRPALPLVGFGIAYGIWVATLDAKFARYQMPLVPVLLVRRGVGA